VSSCLDVFGFYLHPADVDDTLEALAEPSLPGCLSDSTCIRRM